MIFAQMIEIVAMSDLASVLCARKFLFAPKGGIYPPKMLEPLYDSDFWFPGLVRKGTYKFALVRALVRTSVSVFRSTA